MRQKIVFVDEDRDVLERMKSVYGLLEAKWDMAFLREGETALGMLEEGLCEGVISGVQTVGMTGFDFLSKVRDGHPDTVRILRFDLTDEKEFWHASHAAHQFLSDYSAPTILVESLERAFWVRDLLKRTNLPSVISNIHTLPTLPQLYFEVTKELDSATPNLRRIADMVAVDVSMVAKMLQIVNSVIFGLRVKVNDPIRAAVYLGLNMIRGLVLSSKVFSVADESSDVARNLGDIWSHSMNVGLLARKILAAEEADKSLVDDVFTAGLLHDVGKLLLAANLPDDDHVALESAKDGGISHREAEVALLGASHAEIGAYLIGLSGFPMSIIESILYHHNPRECPNRNLCVMTAVHAADALEHERAGESELQGLDEEYLEGLGLLERVEAWRGLLPGEE